MKKVRIIISSLCLLAIVGGIVSLGFHLKKVFQKKELAIDQTANVITEIRKISELNCACFYEEIVLRGSKTNDLANNAVTKGIAKTIGKKNGRLIEDELVIVAKGNVKAGYDLAKIQKEDLTISGDTLCVMLPKPEILDVVINPSDFDIFVEDGDWTYEQVQRLEKQADNKIKEDALKAGVLNKAQTLGKLQLEKMLSTFGFKVVEVSVKD